MQEGSRRSAPRPRGWFTTDLDFDFALAVGTVAERLGVGQSNASQQLALLRRGGLLTSRRDGKQVCYRIDSAAVDRSLAELRDYLHTCCPPGN